MGLYHELADLDLEVEACLIASSGAETIAYRQHLRTAGEETELHHG
ncbi:hypothetical protein [Leptolyngbya sp. FACHB-261]|nr:hypothetical protein [Leptolyngbya sp. FACHB-261]MBD2104110.1 hypothetical protein [Leptolyngbya sp. FACHB-261]